MHPMHPDDAARCGVASGDTVTVQSEAGSIDIPVEITKEIKPGVVSIPHGWGHGQPETRVTTANAHAGVNTNILSPPHFTDEISGNAAVNGIPVTVRLAGQLSSRDGTVEYLK